MMKLDQKEVICFHSMDIIIKSHLCQFKEADSIYTITMEKNTSI